MPIRSCWSKGRPGFKWGSSGKCYTYKAGDMSSKARAENKAKEQRNAILRSQNKK